MRDTNDKERCFYPPYVRSRGCMYLYRFHKSGFKRTPVVLMCPTVQGLVEDVMYVSQGKIPIYEGGATYQWSCEESGLTSWSDQLAFTSAGLQRSLYSNILTPKCGGSFILASLTNRSHQVDLKSLRGPYIVNRSFCRTKTGNQCWTYTYVISLPVLEGYYFGMEDSSGSSVVWKSSGPWWSPSGNAVKG